MSMRIMNADRLLGYARAVAFAALAITATVAGAEAFDTQPAETDTLVQDVQFNRDRGERDRDRGDDRDDDRAEERFKDKEGEWVLLGRRKVGFLVDRDVIEVGQREGRFDRILLSVKRNDIEILDIRVVYGNGQSDELRVREFIREGARTRPIELRGEEGRLIRQIEVAYRSKPSFQGQAVLFVYGRQAAARRELTDGKKAGCETYAALSVVQSEANEKYRCGFRGGEWSDNKRGHYEWCLRNKRDFMADETRYRLGELQKCYNKLGDYDDENYDRGYSRRRF
ncbi:MAG: DUF2541 family protein [Chitinophagales bacterium]|nr:DUF2541 family protein [Hyphomicrobiales bacterium]